MKTINEYLNGNTYPGRGVLIGKSADNAHYVTAYFIMGRSENSRNRIFEPTEDGIRTRAFDEKKLTDPSLIIYSPVRKVNGCTVVTNGDQTDTVACEIAEGGSFESALRKRSFEPDAPNFTPRISGILYPETGEYTLSILKAETPDGTRCRRNFYNYEPEAGTAHLIHTYEHDGSPLPSFCGEPVRIALNAPDAETLAEEIWAGLDENNRVSLFVRFTGCADGAEDTFIINRHTR